MRTSTLYTLIATLALATALPTAQDIPENRPVDNTLKCPDSRICMASGKCSGREDLACTYVPASSYEVVAAAVQGKAGGPVCPPPDQTPRCDIDECGSAIIQIDQEKTGGKGTCGFTTFGPNWQGCECNVMIFGSGG